MRMATVLPILVSLLLFLPWKVDVTQKWWGPLSLSTTLVPKGTISVWGQAQSLTGRIWGCIFGGSSLEDGIGALDLSGQISRDLHFTLALRVLGSQHPPMLKPAIQLHTHNRWKCPLQDSVRCLWEKNHSVLETSSVHHLLRESFVVLAVVYTVPSGTPRAPLQGFGPDGWVGRGWGLPTWESLPTAILLWGSSLQLQHNQGKGSFSPPNKFRNINLTSSMTMDIAHNWAWLVLCSLAPFDCWVIEGEW